MDKKNTNFGGFSSALLRENFKQQWYVPALLFILYFLSGIFPVLMMNLTTPIFDRYLRPRVFSKPSWFREVEE